MIRLSLDEGALDKVLSGETEVGISIKNSIIESVMKKHIKSICNDTLYKDMVKGIVDDVQKNIKNIIFDSYEKAQKTNVISAELNSDYLSALKMIVNRQVEYCFNKYTNEYVAQISENIDKLINERISQYIDTIIVEKMNRLIDTKLKEILIGSVSNVEK